MHARPGPRAPVTREQAVGRPASDLTGLQPGAGGRGWKLAPSQAPPPRNGAPAREGASREKESPPAPRQDRPASRASAPHLPHGPEFPPPLDEGAAATQPIQRKAISAGPLRARRATSHRKRDGGGALCRKRPSRGSFGYTLIMQISLSLANTSRDSWHLALWRHRDSRSMRCLV